MHNCGTSAGFSGGPLLNESGEVVAVHVTADSFEGAAVTLEAIRAFMKENKVEV